MIDQINISLRIALREKHFLIHILILIEIDFPYFKYLNISLSFSILFHTIYFIILKNFKNIFT